MAHDDWSWSQFVEEKEDGPAQDSSEWHVWRGLGLGSSDAPVLMGKSPWRDINDLYLEKTGEVKSEFKMNWAMQRGKDLEPVARDIYCFKNRIDMRPATFTHPRYKFMRASFDGFSKGQGYGIEIKVPGKKDIELAKQNIVSPKYYPQVQWLMIVSQSPFLDYCTLDHESGELHITRVVADPEYQRRMISYARWFWYLVKTKQPPPFRKAKNCALIQIRDGVPELQGPKKVSSRKKP